MMEYNVFDFTAIDMAAEQQKPAQQETRDVASQDSYPSAPVTGPAAFFATLAQRPSGKSVETPAVALDDDVVVKPAPEAPAAPMKLVVPPGGIHIAKPATTPMPNTLSLTAPSRPQSERSHTLREARRRIAMEPPSGDREQPIEGFVYTIRPFIAGGGHIKSVMWSPSGRPITDQLPGPAHKPARRGRIPAVPPGP